MPVKKRNVGIKKYTKVTLEKLTMEVMGGEMRV
jgi:hypothetical protein